MPSLLRPRLSCFYCGVRSAYTRDGRTRQFDCSNCAATNHLDANGDIADPPSTPTVKPTTSFAHPAPRPTSPIQSPENENLFCKNCLKNQQLLTTTLAEYLPPEDDPNYDKFEAQYPEYRKKLELRYPQVCLQCAPRVQKHLNKTAYQAKVDFLTRNIERSKFHRLSNVSTTTSICIFGLNLVATVWWGSVLTQSLWHALAFAGINGERGEVAGFTPSMIVSCSINGAISGILPAGCTNLFVDVVRKSLFVGLFLLWWNPAIKDKLRFPARTQQASGVPEFYRFQLAIFVVRALAWWNLRTPWLESSTNDVTKGFHGCMLLFILLTSLASFRMVNYSAAPKVSFKANTTPLVDPNSFQYPTQDFTSMPSNQPPTASPIRPPFPLANLGTRRTPQAASPSASHIPTPPPESTAGSNLDDFDDSMDWEPIDQSSPIRPSHTFQPSPASAISAFLRPAPSMATGEKSPFTGRLPPAPMSPAHRLRNPPPPPQFKPAPSSQQQDFFQRMGLSSAKIPVISKKPARSADKPSAPPSQTYVSSFDKSKTKDSFDIRPAQWTLKSDMEAATKGTGLEDMFTTSFKIADEPTPRPQTSNRGDGHPVFAVRGNGSAEAASTIVQRNLRDAMLPIGLAVFALLAAVLRDPGAREWMGRIWENVMVRNGKEGNVTTA